MRKTLTAAGLCLAIFGTIQPGPLARYLKGAASGEDADGFVPRFQILFYPDPPARAVDFYQFGRRSPVTHAAALDMARRDAAFYIYDTIFNVPLPDHRAHRELMAAIMKRSRYFFSYSPGEDPDKGPQDDCLSTRYFEAVSGGAVLLGNAPDSPEYRQCFGWPDSTIRIPYEAHDLADIVAELESQPERLEQARRNNTVAGLRRHDWAYRWAQVLDAAGLAPSTRMDDRVERLEELATMAEGR